MKCTEKIELIKKVFEKFHSDKNEVEYDFDTIDVCMAIEEILEK